MLQVPREQLVLSGQLLQPIVRIEHLLRLTVLVFEESHELKHSRALWRGGHGGKRRLEWTKPLQHRLHLFVDPHPMLLAHDLPDVANGDRGSARREPRTETRSGSSPAISVI